MKYYAYKNAKGRMNQPGDLPTNLAGLSDETLKTHGYYPVEMPEISLEANQVFSHYTMSFADDTVTATPVIRGMTDEEIAAKLAERKQAVAKMRYEKEIAGAVIDGQEIYTDVNSQIKLIMVTLAALISDQTAVNWKGKDGTWKAKDADAIKQTFMAAVQKGQALFNAEKQKVEALDTDIDTDITTGWPE